MGEDKNWAKAYVIDPLIQPDPSEETGLNAHFRSTFAPASAMTPSPPPYEAKSGAPVTAHATGSSTDTNPFRRRAGSSSYPTPPSSASPRREKFAGSHREQAFASYADDKRQMPISPPGASGSGEAPITHRRRGSSLGARYDGDLTHRPLDMLRKDSKRAQRSPHLRKQNVHGTDVIDKLDPVGQYHHESAYDAASLARNRVPKYSPIAALKTSNEEALKATPAENITNSVQRHHPLEGTAVVPPGMPDRMGRTYSYEEGSDLMRENGANYKRWPGVTYLPNDLKGKGEPSYSIEKSLKDHNSQGGDIELRTHSRNKSMGSHGADPAAQPSMWDDDEAPRTHIGRSNTTGRRVGEGLKNRLLRRKA